MSDESGEDEPPSFEERLKAARSRQGLDAPPPMSGTRSDDMGGISPNGMSPWGIGLRVGIELVSALVVAVAIGYGLDYWFGTRPILTAVFVLLGGAAGILNVWRMFAPRPTTRPTMQDRGR
jgi:ATP synthase protein I